MEKIKITNNNENNGYLRLKDNIELKLKGVGQDMNTGEERLELVNSRIPEQIIEESYIQNCDTLAGMLDGTITESVHFMGDSDSTEDKRLPLHERELNPGGPRHPDAGPIEYVVALDKSMRPAWRLMRKVWNNLSDEKMPSVFYRNIDKNRWSSLMAPDTENPENSDISKISFDNYDSATTEDSLPLREHLARIRATFLSGEDLDKIDEDNIEEAFNYPTMIDEKRVAIVDEVESSGATLKIADMLMRAAIPEAKFEPMYWSVPGKVSFSNGEFAARTVPFWYDDDNSTGRIIRDLDVNESLKSENKKQRMGAYVLSTPFRDGRNSVDYVSEQTIHDLDILANRFNSGEMELFMPSTDRDVGDIEDKLSKYYKRDVRFEDFRDARDERHYRLRAGYK